MRAMKLIATGFILLDMAILSRSERFAHAVQRQTGWNNLVLRNAAMAFAGGCILCRVLLQAWTTGRFRGSWAIDYLLIAWIAMYVLFSEHDEQQAQFRAQRGLCNPRKISPAHLLIRWLWLYLTAFGVALVASMPHDPELWLNLGMSLGFWLATVFEACDPLPPCRGKMREWLEAVRLKPVAAGGGA